MNRAKEDRLPNDHPEKFEAKDYTMNGNCQIFVINISSIVL